MARKAAAPSASINRSRRRSPRVQLPSCAWASASTISPQPHVGEDQLPHVAPEPALFPQLDRRDAQGLLVDLHRLGIAGALDRAADVRPVSPAGGPRGQLAVREDRLVESHVRVLQVGAPDVVVDEDVPVVNVAVEEIHQVAAARVQGKGHQRQVLVLLQHPAPGIQEP